MQELHLSTYIVMAMDFFLTEHPFPKFLVFEVPSSSCIINAVVSVQSIVATACSHVSSIAIIHDYNAAFQQEGMLALFFCYMSVYT